jgi:hypothetical protein
MTPADPREVLQVLRLRLQQAMRMAAMLPPDALGPVYVRDEMTVDLARHVSTTDAAIGGEG